MGRSSRVRLRRLVVAALLAPILFDGLYLAWLWPDWAAIADGPVPKSRFIEEYEERRAADRALPALRWKPVAVAALPEHVERAVVLAEDSRFYLHHGIDWEAVREATEANLERGEVARGASTISQQTVKNLFLSQERTWLRKWHELVLTWALERNLTKRRILGLYVNIVELGEGLFGVEAAARAYFGVGAASLTSEQAAELAATLPSPVQHNPKTRTKPFLQRRERVLEYVERFAPGLRRPGAARELPPSPNGQ